LLLLLLLLVVMLLLLLLPACRASLLTYTHTTNRFRNITTLGRVCHVVVLLPATHGAAREQTGTLI
jgi:hypothetical protein